MTPAGPGVVVLAAGASRRMGVPKQLVRLGNGRSLLRHAAVEALATGFAPVLVVLGAAADRLEPELDGLAVQTLRNPLWQAGLSTSVRAGVEALEAAGAAAALLTVCDQPHVSAALLCRLAAAHEPASGRTLVACEYGEAVGVPALFDRCHFPELLALEGDRGARAVLLRHAPRVVRIAFPLGAVDLDTPADLARLGP